ncbi:MAG: hypothetical protein R2828_22120 [Saprospiraceae bacterium]
MIQIELYKSVLKKLSQVPVNYLTLVDTFLSSINGKTGKKEENRAAVLGLAGSWQEMSEVDFADFLNETKKISENIFTREVDL